MHCILNIIGLFVISLHYCNCATKPPGKPHIIFIVADDLGFNDVGFNNPSMKTPNIDKLASEGVILDQSYVQPVCTPSRAAMLSGKYPFRLGLQFGAFFPEEPACLPVNVTLLPQRLKQLGYATHIVGKWHLGFCNWKCTPTERGFDSFYGFYNGMEDYYTHSIGTLRNPKDVGLDFYSNKTVVKNENGTYSTHLFTERAIDIIEAHNMNQPLYLYLPFQAVHIPIQVPKKYEDMYPEIKTEGRRKYCGMVSALDEAVGKITEALKSKGLYDNSIIVFTADNGGWPQEYGNNYPLRGGKITIWEGGTRAAAMVHSPLLKETGYRNTGMMHAVDWFSTVLELAGGSPEPEVDGMPMWDVISDNAQSKRNEFIYNLDNATRLLSNGHAAIRVGDYKLIHGNPGPYSDWYKPDQVSAVVEKEKHIFPWTKMLFNLKDDPTEHNDLSKSKPEVVKKLMDRLEYYQAQVVPALNPPTDPAGSPSKYGGVWTPGWC